MFDGIGFDSIPSFMGFNPHNFATNFSQNFRSFGGFDDEILRRVMEMSSQQEHKKPTQADALARLPIVEIQEVHCKKQDGSSELECPTCTVCCESMKLGTKALFIPCGHTFHPECIVPWLKEHNTCPICRYELPTSA
jgi:E3 ubiquitin-protein ligase AIP2